MPSDRQHYGPSPSRRKKLDELWGGVAEDSRADAVTVISGTLNGIVAGDGTIAPSVLPSSIPATLLDAKGDLIAASAADTAGKLTVGADGTSPIADATQTLGIKWGVVGRPPVVLHPPYLAASTAATNLAATTFSAVDDPNYRWMLDLRNLTKLRIQGRIGGSLVAATKLRVQYHTGGDPAVSSADGGWTTLATTAGSHTLATMFYSAEIAVPTGARINDVLIRVGLYDGDGAADPTISCLIANFYP